MPKSVLVLGLRYEPPSANVDIWRMERFALPEALAGVHGIRVEIKKRLTEADDGVQSLRSSLWKFQRHLLIHSERKREDDLRKEEKVLLNKMVDSAGSLQLYWHTLESSFHGILREYTLERDSEDIRCQWLKSVRDTLMSAWAQHSASVSTGDAWAIRAVVKAEGPVLRKFKELNDEILKLEPQKETA